MCVLGNVKTQTAIGKVSNTHPSTVYTGKEFHFETLRIEFLYDTNDHVGPLSCIIYIVKYVKGINSARQSQTALFILVIHDSSCF